jgi:hypothetical protein
MYNFPYALPVLNNQALAKIARQGSLDNGGTNSAEETQLMQKLTGHNESHGVPEGPECKGWNGVSQVGGGLLLYSI